MYGWCLVSLFEYHWHPHPQQDYRPNTLPLRNPYIGGYALKDPANVGGIVILLNLNTYHGEDSKLI